MFKKIILAAALVALGGVALASDASYDQQQVRTASAAPAERAPQPAAAEKAAMPCACQHRHGHS